MMAAGYSTLGLVVIAYVILCFYLTSSTDLVKKSELVPLSLADMSFI